ALAQPSTRAAAEWPSAADCAKRLAWSDWQRYEAQSGILSRTTDTPFTSQMNHQQQYEKMRHALEQLRPATSPAGLQRAIEACRAAVVAFPGDWILNKELALAQEQGRDYAGAVECWEAVLHVIPQYAEGWQLLARARAELKQDDK